MEGPYPARKLTLRCKKGCGAVYSVDTYTSGDTKFYDQPTKWLGTSNRIYLSTTV